MSSDDPQNTHTASSFRMTIASFSTEIASSSPSWMLNKRLVSAGTTTRPRSSIFRTIPMFTALLPTPLSVSRARSTSPHDRYPHSHSRSRSLRPTRNKRPSILHLPAPSTPDSSTASTGAFPTICRNETTAPIRQSVGYPAMRSAGGDGGEPGGPGWPLRPTHDGPALDREGGGRRVVGRMRHRWYHLRPPSRPRTSPCPFKLARSS